MIKEKFIVMSIVTAVMLAICCTPPPTVPTVNDMNMIINISSDGSWSGSNWAGTVGASSMSGVGSSNRVQYWSGIQNYPNINYWGASVRFATGTYVRLDIVTIKYYSSGATVTTTNKSVTTNVNGDYVTTVLNRSEI